MKTDANDIVCVASGSLIHVETWHELLATAGIESRVVGDNLAGGRGTALPNSVELCVHRVDAKVAQARIGGAGEHRPWEPESHPVPPHSHSLSDPNPDHSRGPQHGAPPHRPLPS
ncbi:MAG TPA: hypothetical protein VG122_21670 [Gemmata sp.]|jgi:hypothetical protein|nr:hypothetical protein [Gemmata sp.]